MVKYNKLLGFFSKKYRELYEEKEVIQALLNNTWLMLDKCKLDFSNGVTDNHGTVDEGYVKGWAFYHQLEQEASPYLKFFT